MPITVGLLLERDEFDELAGILKMSGKRVGSTLTDCLRREAAVLKDEARRKLESSDAESVRTDVQTPKHLPRKIATKGTN